jgi:uncharacterized protein YbcI
MGAAMADAARRAPSSVAVSNRTVELFRRYTGRGPTEARTTIDRDHVLVVMRNGLTVAERTLSENGYSQLVRDCRRAVQEIVRPELTEFIEEHFGRKVIGFMSDNHVDPDLAGEIFVLEPEDRSADTR